MSIEGEAVVEFPLLTRYSLTMRCLLYSSMRFWPWPSKPKGAILDKKMKVRWERVARKVYVAQQCSLLTEVGESVSNSEETKKRELSM